MSSLRKINPVSSKKVYTMNKISPSSQINAYNGQNQDQNNQVHIWCDGCYDMAHVGHIYSLWHAKAYGATLTVGVHSDDEIKRHKGLPVFSQEERYEMIRSIKFVDHVVEKSPYVTCPETIKQHNCDICIHGTDTTTTVDGTDTYLAVKEAGMYKEMGRIPGVSTTQFLNKILHLLNNNQSHFNINQQYLDEDNRCDDFLTELITALKSNNIPQSISTPLRKVVYASGAFDILHPGNLSFLKTARSFGNFLLIGLHDDKLVKSYKGPIFPIMSQQKRHAALLACKYVDEVITGAPYTVTSKFLDTFNVSIVVQGKLTNIPCDPDSGKDPYEVPKIRNIYYEVDSKSTLTTETLLERIGSMSSSYKERNAKKISVDSSISFRYISE